MVTVWNNDMLIWQGGLDDDSVPALARFVNHEWKFRVFMTSFLFFVYNYPGIGSNNIG